MVFGSGCIVKGLKDLLACGIVANAVYYLAAQIHQVGVIIKEQQLSMRKAVLGRLGRQHEVCPAFRNVFFGTGCRVWRVELVWWFS